MADLLSYALTTVADVKETLGLDAGDTSKDNLIKRKINQATLAIETFCNLPRDHHFKETTYTNEVYTGNGSNQLVLLMRPVSSITSFQYHDSPESDASYSNVESEDYYTDLESGLLNLNYTSGSHWGSYRVTYTAGYSTIPFDLSEAAATLAAFWVENSTTGTNVKRKKEGQREIEYFQQGGSSEGSNESIIESLGLDDILNRYIQYNLMEA